MKTHFIFVYNLFGNSISIRHYMHELSKFGSVTLFEFYKEVPTVNSPNFLKILLYSKESGQKIMNSTVLKMNIKKIMSKLHDMGTDAARHTVLIGHGFGANLILNLLENNPQPYPLALLWYPHLIFSPSYLSQIGNNSLPPPNPKFITSGTKINFFYGENDNVVEKENLSFAKRLTYSMKNTVLHLFPNTGHGYMEPFVKDSFPNPLYWFNPAAWRARRESWKIALEEIEKVARDGI